ncbi:MAG: initiation control protein YabA [Clostridiales bacterium]
MLGQALLELEEKIKAMGDELATIRKYVEQLEADNISMQAIIRKKNMAVSGKSNLLALFDAGFHVCPSHFGEVREGECLFCVSFMEKEKLKEKNTENNHKDEE